MESPLQGGTDPVTRAQAGEGTVDSSRAVIKDGIYYPNLFPQHLNYGRCLHILLPWLSHGVLGPAGKGCPTGGTSSILGAARNSHRPQDGGGCRAVPLLAHLPALFLGTRFPLKSSF